MGQIYRIPPVSEEILLTAAAQLARLPFYIGGVQVAVGNQLARGGTLQAPAPGWNTSFSNVPTGQGPDSLGDGIKVGTSALGTPVMSNLSLTGVVWTGSNGQRNDQTGITVTIDTVLFVVSQKKKMIRTPVMGANGTVKEYIALDDFEISITGVITNNSSVQGPGTLNQSDVYILSLLLQAPVPYQITSSYLNGLGVYNIVVSDYSFPQLPGEYSQQTFSISAYSDSPITFGLTPGIVAAKLAF